MFAIAFIPYRILTCFKRIIPNAGAKLQIKNEIFLRSREKLSFLTFASSVYYCLFPNSIYITLVYVVYFSIIILV